MLVFGLLEFFIEVGGGSGFPEDLAHRPASDIKRSEFVQDPVERQLERDAGLLTDTREFIELCAFDVTRALVN